MLLVLVILLNLIQLVYQLLFLLNILEHVLAFREDDEVGEDLGVFVVEAAEFGESDFGLLLVVSPLQELIDVV